MTEKEWNQLKAGDVLQAFFLLKSVECKTTTGNKRYLDMVMVDRAGEINAKLWDCSQEDETTYAANSLVKVKGVLAEWQNRLQLKVEKIRPATQEDGLQLADFVPAAPLAAEDMYREVMEYAEQMQQEDIGKIVRHILEMKKEKLQFYPAAKQNHHSIRSGLLYHILTMLKAGQKMCEIYTTLNKDLLFAGIILHDIAKLDEMEASELGLVSQYTVQGELLGHIIQGIKLVESTASQVGASEEVSFILQHMILSHHYEPEFGSPKRPMIPEAELLHHLDMIDARMYDMQKIMSTLEPGQISDKVWLLENRKLYRPVFGGNEGGK